MNVLTFLIIIVVIAAQSEQSYVPKPECYRNKKDGLCGTFGTECINDICVINNPENLPFTKDWTKTNSTDCAKRTRKQLKICNNDCPNFVSANCTGNPVCAISVSRQKCRVFKSECDMKKVACRDSKLKDWRKAANKTACNGLRLGARAAKCTVLI